MLKIRRPVKVFAVLTENLRFALFQEIDLQLQQFDRNLDELAWKRRRLDAEPGQHSAEALQQLELERRHTLEAKQRLGERRKEIAQLDLGVEILHSKAESDVEVHIGDYWEQISNPEIVLEDGRIIAIRSDTKGERQ